jgi:hypothetical protein
VDEADKRLADNDPNVIRYGKTWGDFSLRCRIAKDWYVTPMQILNYSTHEVLIYLSYSIAKGNIEEYYTELVRQTTPLK